MASHRYTYSSGVKAVEAEKHGRDMAEKRYGPLQNRDGAAPPKDQSRVQATGDAGAAGAPPKKYPHDVPANSWSRGQGEQKPGYIRRSKR